MTKNLRNFTFCKIELTIRRDEKRTVITKNG